jgi:hypothetical protein
MAAISIERLDAIREAQEKRRMDGEIVLHRWRLAKQTMWLSLLACSFLMFYLIDVMQESMVLLAMRY